MNMSFSLGSPRPAALQPAGRISQPSQAYQGSIRCGQPATGTLFADMTNKSYYATSWAEQAYKDGLIPSCGMSGGKPKLRPKDLVSRGLAAYIIVRAKGLTLP